MNEELHRTAGLQLEELEAAGTYKHFNVIRSPQGPLVEMKGRGEVIVLSSNNYLGLANDPEVVSAGIDGLRHYGAGTASVRFICGTFAPHVELEHDLASFSGTEAALTYASCWNANEAVIPTVADQRTALFSDELNHASIVDAIRLARPASKVIYPHVLRSQIEVPIGVARTDHHERGHPEEAVPDRRLRGERDTCGRSAHTSMVPFLGRGGIRGRADSRSENYGRLGNT